MKPMLAFKYQQHRAKVTLPCYLQPKLDGIRMLFQAGYCQSRDEHLWAPQMHQHIRSALANITDDVILDGELYIHGMPLQKINSFCSLHPNATPKPNSEQLQYHVFDCYLPLQPDMPFSARTEWLSFSLSHIGSPVHIVPTHRITEAEDLESYHTQYRDAGYEGTMIRRADSPYGTELTCGNKENRWTHLLKRKDWLDSEYQIIDFETTTGDKGERGFRLICVTEEGLEFAVGTGLSDLEVTRYAENPPIGKKARLRYDIVSSDGKPLKATLEAIL